MASLAPAKAEVGAVAKADQKFFVVGSLVVCKPILVFSFGFDQAKQ